MHSSPDSAGIRVGFVPALDRHAGGVFQYSATMMDALAAIAKQEKGVEIVALVPDGVAAARTTLEAAGWRVVPVTPPVGRARGALRRIVGDGPHRDAWRWLRRRMQSRTEPAAGSDTIDAFARRDDLGAWWRRHGIDLVIFPQPHPWAFEAGVPSILAIHDLQHRLQPEFPEVSADGEWERREYVFRNCVRAATGILVDSDVGKEQMLLFYGPYGIGAEQVHVLPFLPASTMPREVPFAARAAVRARYGVPDDYIFYPAQFWPHKNHARIIEALEQLKRRDGIVVAAVFCGSHADAVRARHFELLMNMARQCGVADQIRVLDFVPDDELAALYAGARALVMPTFFGPTNIPVLEAWALGCPVLTSDIPGIREQVGDAGVLVDPRRVDELADGIRRLWSDEALRLALAQRGTRRLALYGPADFRERLLAALRSARAAL
jgi:glycosyltransferase involved in cell wall biosynthesis